ncbi:hypothetical protein EON83_01100 [bacterium]|nr:MAG: hypothetical protein EON83_01100 [bacterium]
MSFNYTPPPEEISRNGQMAQYALYAAMLLIPKVRVGALIAGLGSAIIAYQVASHAKGDLGGLSALINPPVAAVFGALIGGLASFISKTVLRFLLKAFKSPATHDKQDEEALPK